MNRLPSLVAAVSTALGTLISIPVAAQPRRGRSQVAAVPAPAPAAPADDDGDGPEARGVALFKLDDLLEVAIRLSPDIARARVERDAARGDAGAARKDQSWVLSASASYDLEALGDTQDSSLSPLTVLSTSKLLGNLGLNRKLPTGGEIGVQLDLSHQRQELNLPAELLRSSADQSQIPQSNCGETVDIFCQDQASAKLTFKQPLARGFGSDVALAPERKADLAAADATLKAQVAAEEMIRDLVKAYWELAYTAYEVDVRAEALELARKQDQMTRQEVRAGTQSQNALDAVSYQIALREEALLTAKLDHEKKSLELRRKAGLEIGRRDIVIRPGEPLELDKQEWNIDQVLAQSHRSNRHLASIVLEKKMADVDVDVTHNATLPQVDLNVSGAVLGTGDTPSAAFSAVGGDGNGFGYQILAGLTMSFELSGAARSANDAAIARRRKLDVERVDRERQIDADVTTAAKAVQSGRQRVALDDKAIAVAEDNVRAARANFLAQRGTNFDVMQRQTELVEARLRRGRAVADYRTAVADLLYASGTLLDTYRVHVRSADTGAGKE